MYVSRTDRLIEFTNQIVGAKKKETNEGCMNIIKDPRKHPNSPISAHS